MQQPSKDPNKLTDEEKWQLLTRHEKLGEVLLKGNKISLEQLEALLSEQKSSGLPIGQLIVSKGWLTLDEILDALNTQHLNDKVSLESIIELKTKSTES